MRPQPLIAVADVQASSRWYQRLLGCSSGHGGSDYERLYSSGQSILQLHSLDDDHHHAPIADRNQPFGNGVLLWFELDDFERAVVSAADLGTHVVMPRHRNPNANHWELWLRDPDGYTVVVASIDGSAPSD